MIDYAKIPIPREYVMQLIAHPQLTSLHNVQVNELTGEIFIDKPRTAEYRRMTFTLFPCGKMTLHGSWHKYAKEGRNCGDFSFSEFIATVTEFCDTFGLDPGRLPLRQLEAGVNIGPQIPVREILRSFVCTGDGKSFSLMRSKRGHSLGLELYRTEYGLKIYDKGKQYGLPSPLLRFEVKYTGGKKFRRDHCIYHLSDLLHVTAWQSLSEQVIELFDDLIMKETSIDPDTLTIDTKLFFIDAGTPDYWQRIGRKQRPKKRTQLQRLIDLNGRGNLKDDLRKLIAEKLHALNNLPELGENRGHIPLQREQKEGTFSLAPDLRNSKKVGDVFPDIVEPSKTQNRGHIPTSYNGGNCPGIPVRGEDTQTLGEGEQENTVKGIRRCKSCGRNISHQRPGSIFCSERQFGKEGKKCRNAHSNPRNNDKRRLKWILKDSLFDQTEFLKPIRHMETPDATGT